MHSHKKREKPQKRDERSRVRCSVVLSFIVLTWFSWPSLDFVSAHESLAQITERLAKESTAAYEACRFSVMSKDYFNRFSRDPHAVAKNNDTTIDPSWRIVLPENVSPLGRLMATHLQTFLRERMNVAVAIEAQDAAAIARPQSRAILLLEFSNDKPKVADSFSIKVEPDRIVINSQSPAGLRDGIVRLVDRIGFREAAILEQGSTIYEPRLHMRLGTVPAGGSYKDVAFFGFNAVLYGGGDLYALSQSDAIPELAVRRVPGQLQSQEQAMKELAKYGLKAYAWLNTRQKFPKDDRVFKSHPEIRGALTWAADGEYTLCTSHPLVRRYLKESIQGIFKALPELQGVVLIVGGEGFYHCHMRPFGVAKGHTNCPRCEKLGAETAVADLCNDLASAARSVRPNAEVVLWPYSAEHVWAADFAVTGFLEKLKPGTALLTEVEKSETIKKPNGVSKAIWDYSIDFIGPATRTKQQIATCAKHHIPVYLKSEPELAFEAPLLPQVPCMDRWADRAEVLASCGADGAWIFPAFRPFYGASTAEINKFLWWTPTPDRETLLHDFAKRLAGPPAADALRAAWKQASRAIEYSPELPSYYVGPYYLGPMHPMCANPKSPLPNVFYGQFLFHAEAKDPEGLKKEPTFNTSPTGDVRAFGDCYRKMRNTLQVATAYIRGVEPLVDKRHRLTFDAEAIPILWFYHTARTQSNFYQSCQLRNSVLAATNKASRTVAEREDAGNKLRLWKDVLTDELQNTRDAEPLLRQDVRLDPYYGGDHTFSHGEQMIKAKLGILQLEVTEYLPSVAEKVVESH